MPSAESPLSALDLPPSTSPTLHLTPATPTEKELVWCLNGSAWRGPLPLSTYLRREAHLGSQPLTLNGGITYWVLTDSSPAYPLTNGYKDTTTNASSAPPRTILASCETLRKRALIAYPPSPSSAARVDDTITHGVGSVFCRPEFRKRGYAGRMMRELGKNLETHQQAAGQKAKFTVLYSDIGKQFYAKEGWNVFPSGHVTLRPIPDGENGYDGELNGGDFHKEGVRELHAGDLRELCEVDEKLLRKRIGVFKKGDGKARVALIPDVETVQWHHAREEFAAKEMLGRGVDVNGAIVDAGVGKRVWAIWTRTFAEKVENNTLHILRMVVEGEEGFGAEVEGEGDMGKQEPRDERNVRAAAAVLRAAQKEAGRWPMHAVEVWNPSTTIVAAARRVQPDAEIVERESESITSLMWYGDGTAKDEGVDWVGNEKYAWV
ncbi:hypothetical protein MMC30_002712 [Trapelia coarctata]|nr:hypothetical protein [Trapelia coarctata]